MENKKKEFPWHILWYISSTLWLLTFCEYMFYYSRFAVLAFLNIFVSLVAGIVNGRRYKKRQKEE